MRTDVSACLAFFGAVLLSGAAAASERLMYVTGDNLNVRLCADSSCCVARRLARGTQVTVFEETDGWSRISLFYDPERERSQCPTDETTVAQWVSARYLTSEAPPDFDPNAWSGALADRRIRGMPRVGDYGLKREDIRILRRYAAQLLASGDCEAIEAGSKSVSTPDSYFVFCAGDSEQRMFTPADLDGN